MARTYTYPKQNMMDYCVEGQAIITNSDSESSNEENQLSEMQTEPSSDSNESVDFEIFAWPPSTHHAYDRLIVAENVRELNQQSPTEHDEIQNLPFQPDDNSIASTASEDTTDDEKEETSITLRANRKRLSTLKGTIASKIFFDETYTESSGSSSDSGRGILGIPSPPEDNSISSTASEDTTDDKTEEIPITLRTNRERLPTPEKTTQRKLFLDEPCTESSGSSSDNGSQNSSVELSLSADD